MATPNKIPRLSDDSDHSPDGVDHLSREERQERLNKVFGQENVEPFNLSDGHQSILDEPEARPDVTPDHSTTTSTQGAVTSDVSAESEDVPGPVQQGSGLEQAQVRHIPHFNSMEFHQRVDFRDIALDNPERVPAMIRERVERVIHQAMNEAQPGSVLNVVLRGPSLASDIQRVLDSSTNYSADLFMEEISQVLQSNDDSIARDELEIVVMVAQNRSGGARLKLGSVPYDQILSKKCRFLYNPNNGDDDNLCFSLCLVHFASASASVPEKLQRAKQLQNAVGFDHTQRISFDDVTKFEKHLNVKIIIFHHGPGRKRLQCFQTHDEPHANTIWLYLHNEHYYLIENQTGFFGASYVCQYCYDTYNTPLLHRCKACCNVCCTRCSERPGETVKCKDCMRICRSEYCYRQHKLREKKHNLIPCDRVKRCNVCSRIYSVGKKPHKCAPVVCQHCKAHILNGDLPHECYIQPLEKPEPDDKYIFYDFETRYHDGKHEANFVCAMDMNGKKFCFETLKCVGAFVKRYRCPKFKGYTFIAHNASGFDNYILLEYFIKQKILPTVIMKGSRVILMSDDAYRQRWIDSFSFLPMSLARTPAALGFEDLEKGYFPHKFNTRDNKRYVGAYPDPSYYGYDRMTVREREKFMAWYDTVREGVFDFRAEMRRYCVNDVRVLHKACTVYRDTFLQCTQLDPFAFTILASSCMGVFKTLFLPKDTLALTYEGAYTEQNKTYSNLSIQWLEYVAHAEGAPIKHALNGGEQRVGPYSVDGFVAATETCYEFAGCFFHGCVKCCVQSDLNPVSKVPFGELFRNFNEKVTNLKLEYGMQVVVMWECEWTAMTKSDTAVKTFLETYRKPERLDPRQALFGGRTNAMKLYHKTVCGEGEKIHYFDFTSLYPTVQSKRDYPVGHPQIIYTNFDAITSYFGFIKCSVLPPRGLYHPVLPYRCNNKLMFPLCRRCSEELNQSTECMHSDGDRELSGTWVSFELQKAVEKGYQIVCIDEVWHFPKTTDTLFKGYVKTFLKCKQEASGYPSHVKTAEDQQKYIDEYYEKEGILLDPAKIRVNKAVRSCNKLLLNSLWGRFSMRPNMPSCELITDPDRFTQLMFSDHFDVRHFCFISDDVAMVQWRHADGRSSRVKDVNVFIGAMTTAYARLMLYELLDKLQQRVLYCDTDSVIFTSRPGEWVPPLGPFLGDLTDELNGGGGPGEEGSDHITEFVSGGPKCYAYRTQQGKTQVKCKGITLNSANAETVTQGSLEKLVHSFVADQNTDAHLTAVSDTIKRDKKKFHLKNETVVKKVQVVYNKRRVLPDYTTLPYGY